MMAHWKVWVAVIPAVFLAALVRGATLGLEESGVVMAELDVRVPVALGVDANDSVAGFQFDIHFDPALLQFLAAEVGASATAAEKSAHANLMRPGRLRVVVAGFNRNSIAGGEPVWLHFRQVAPVAGAAALRLSDVILSDPFGTPVPVRVLPDTLIVSGGDVKAVTTGTHGDAVGTSGASALYRYRALLFAGIVVVFAMLFTKPKARKRRAR